MLELLFEKFVFSNFMKIQHRCFPVNIVKFLRTFILKTICEWVLLFFGLTLFPETEV